MSGPKKGEIATNELTKKLNKGMKLEEGIANIFSIDHGKVLDKLAELKAIIQRAENEDEFLRTRDEFQEILQNIKQQIMDAYKKAHTGKKDEDVIKENHKKRFKEFVEKKFQVFETSTSRSYTLKMDLYFESKLDQEIETLIDKVGVTNRAVKVVCERYSELELTCEVLKNQFQALIQAKNKRIEEIKINQLIMEQKIRIQKGVKACETVLQYIENNNGDKWCELDFSEESVLLKNLEAEISQNHRNNQNIISALRQKFRELKKNEEVVIMKNRKEAEKIHSSELIMEALYEMGYDVSYDDEAFGSIKISAATPDESGYGDIEVQVTEGGEVDFEVNTAYGDNRCGATINGLQERVASLGLEFEVTDWGHSGNLKHHVVTTKEKLKVKNKIKGTMCYE